MSLAIGPFHRVMSKFFPKQQFLSINLLVKTGKVYFKVGESN